jgi:hypothetical protein
MEKAKEGLSEEEKAILRQHYEVKRKDLMNQLEMVEAKIEQYGGTPLKNRAQPPVTLGFPENAKSVADRIVYVLESLGRMSTINQITDHYGKLDPSIVENGKILRNKYAHIYSSLLGKYKAGVLFRIQGRDGAFRYGLKEWQDSDGKVMFEYS